VSDPDVVGKDITKPGETTFEMVATGTAFAYNVPESEPRDTTVKKLGQAAQPGFEIDPSGAIVDVIGPPTVLDDGVHWRVRGKASQFRHVEDAQIQSSVAGRTFDEIAGAVADRGLNLVRVTIWPGLWPRLPLLDSRIKIQKDAPASP
jgi:hypothetical protein